jgi:FAD/FMN-containing dehydrogenase
MTADLSPELLARFAAIVGERHALTAEADIAPHLVEPRGLWAGRTGLVLRPGSVGEVSKILALATQTRTPVVPQGGNTGLVGGGTPDMSGGEIVLSMTVEAGVVLQRVQDEAEAAGRLFPLSLASQGSAQIGGNLSSNAGGTGVLAYGNARDLCLGVEVVLPTGEIFDDLRKLKKDNTGYDLKDLFVGAEGTLGVITAAVLKLYPRPKGREVAWVGLASPERALSLFSLALDRAGSGLTAFELCAAISVDFSVRHTPGLSAPLADRHPWLVLMEISSGRSAEDARALIEEILTEGFEAGLADDAVIAQNLSQAHAFWAIREAMSDAQKPEGASIKHDISVPVAAIPAFIERAGQAVLAAAPGARLVTFGHMGDGNLHYNVSQPEGADRAAFLARYRALNDIVHAVVRDFSGSISAEHGIGRMKRDELLATQPPVATDLMRRIKASVDPAGIMNPGKVI